MNILPRAKHLHLHRIPVFMLSIAVAAFGLLPPMATTTALAADNELTITIKDHKFEPANPEIPAGARIKLTVVNADPTAEEFESHDFHVEKIVGAGKTISVYIGPLEAGTYKFFGERHESTAQGVLTAK
jgi:plastocyanin